MTTHFNNTKYTRWYYAIIQKRAILDNDTRGEVHHIIPRSLGGSDEPTNLVKLSGHDHAWCHWLLTKMTVGMNRASMIYAFNMMGVYGDHMERQSSYAIVRAYERNRLEWSQTHSETMLDQFENGRVIWNKGYVETRPEVLANVKLAAQNRALPSVEERAKRDLKRLASMKKNGTDKRTQETRDKMSASMIGLVRGPMNDAHKKSIGDSMRGKPKADGHRENVVAAVTGNISINRDGIEKKVKHTQLQSYLDDGWVLGGRPRKKRTEIA